MAASRQVDSATVVRARIGAEVTVPPWRHRTADISAPATCLMAGHGGGGGLRCTDGALRALSRAPWPGNVRQLDGSLRYARAPVRVS
ncbi:hypothetical protein [Streptomyces sp. B21-083]|uniref:hypothetical protein n=1 Tax=Streptomyces sp. B21-083 TaxID=3039410 RepID=UPI002FF3E706